MGSGSSYAISPEQSYEDIFTSVAPLYYTTDAVTVEDLVACQMTWNHIINNTAPKYSEVKSSNEFTHVSCISWFYTVFYNRLFDVHPVCKHLFTRGIQSQGKFLVKMITMALSQATNAEKFKALMENLAMTHCQWGVRAIEYGIVGDVLFYSLHAVLGEAYTSAVEQSWCRVYSTMLSLILPVVIRYERESIPKQRNTKELYSKCSPSSTLTCEAISTEDSAPCPRLHANAAATINSSEDCTPVVS